MRGLQRLESAKGTHGRPDAHKCYPGIAHYKVVRQRHEAVKFRDMQAYCLVGDLEHRKETTIRS